MPPERKSNDRTPVHLRRLAASAALAAALGLTALAAPAPASATTPGPALPQTAPAVAGANWLAGQINAEGLHPLDDVTRRRPTSTSTANAVLALASAGVDSAAAEPALDLSRGPTSTPT